MKIAFDVDGTLIYEVGDKENTPKPYVIQLYRIFEKLNFEMYIWSNGGIEYAKEWAEKLNLKAKIVEKGSFIPDIAVDNDTFDLGVITIPIPNDDYS